VFRLKVVSELIFVVVIDGSFIRLTKLITT